MAVNGVIPNTIINLTDPYVDINLIKQAIARLQTFSVNVENCGYPMACQSCQAAGTCQSCQSQSCQKTTCQSCMIVNCDCNCNCNCSDGSDS